MEPEVQVLDLPQGGQGLYWIVSQGPQELLLIPGLQAASIAAAATGDQSALSYLHSAAQQFAADGSPLNATGLDNLCIEASHIQQKHPKKAYRMLDDLLLRHQPLQATFKVRLANTSALLQSAVRDGQLDALKWLQALCHRCCIYDGHLMEVAAEQGHLSILKQLRSGAHPAPWGVFVTHAAARHIECLLWLISQEPPCPVHEDQAALVVHTGDLDAVRRLHAACEFSRDINLDTRDWDADLCAAAARCGSLAILQWLRSLDSPVPWDSRVAAHAAERGDLSMLQWARSQDEPAPWDEECTAAAASNGHIDVLEWMVGQRAPCPLSSTAVTAAAEAGHIAALQWLCSKGFELDMHVTFRAACRGHLPMLKWILAQDPECPLCPHIPALAALCGQVPMLEWAGQQAVLGKSWNGDLYYHAANGGHKEALTWLHKKGVPAPGPDGEGCIIGNVSVPIVLFLGDIGAHLYGKAHQQLVQAQRTLCTFHGLLRWCQRARADHEKYHQAVNKVSRDSSGLHLLEGLSLLPQELITRIAVAVELQHDLISS